jgi:hypothetical protein
MDAPAGITLRFYPRDDQAYRLRLSGAEVGEARGDLVRPGHLAGHRPGAGTGL